MDFAKRDADERRWRDARSFAELCELGARFAEGELACFPGWGWDALDVESDPLRATLARVNRAGLLTLCSQPGARDAARSLEQRAFVCAFTEPALAEHLARLARGFELRIVRADDAEREPVPVTLEHGLVRVAIGGLAHAAERECFEDALAPALLAELVSRPLVCAWSAEFGPETTFWPALLCALDTCGTERALAR